MDKTLVARAHDRIHVSESLVSGAGIAAIDLSEKGMLLHLDKSVSAGTVLSFTLHLEDKSFEVSALVRWCKSATSIFESGVHAGVEFQGHSISAQLAIRDYIASHQP